MELEAWPSIRRSAQNGIIITEKIDGTNAQVAIDEQGVMQVGSRSRWLTADADNFGFFAWCEANRDALLTLGPGRHYGEWYGAGIQRRYGLDHKRFALFNTFRTPESLPGCVEQVPILYKGEHTDAAIVSTMERLQIEGSRAVPGFMSPEGVVVYSFLTRARIKYTYAPKGK
jgi:hypothetical protein